MAQTTVQEPRSLRFGSGKFEVGDDVGSLVNLGAMKNINFAETWDEVQVEADNVGEIEPLRMNQKASLAGDLLEINLEKLNNLRGGLDTYSTVAGSLVEGAGQVVASGDWSFNDFIKIENQNYDGGVITVNSVTGSIDDALTPDDDYFVGENELGEWGIFIIDGTTATVEAQNLTIDYDYTPKTAVKLTSGGNITINPKVVRVTNTNRDGNEFRITIYKATITEGISIELQSDESGEVAVTPINLTGTLDQSRTAGDMLFEIYDEQTSA